jgi:antitoxin HicB
MKKDLSYYLKLHYTILIKQDEDNGKIYYEAEIPDLPGCGAYGKNKKETLDRLEEAKELWISSRLKRNLSIPEPASEENFSGRILVRMPAKLHMQLAINAKKVDLSLNQYIRKTLETKVTFDTLSKEIEELSKKVGELCKEKEIMREESSMTNLLMRKSFFTDALSANLQDVRTIPKEQNKAGDNVMGEAN